MTADVLLTWLAQSTALAAVAAVAVRLPGCRSRAAARNAVWSATLLLCTALLGGLLLEPWLARAADPWPPPAADPAFAPVVLPVASGAVATSLMWLWMAGSALAFAVIVLDVIRVLRMKRRAEPLSDRERRRLGHLADEVQGCRGTRVCWSEALDSPAALGFGRPVVALPRAQASRLSDEQLRQVVLHELAHVRRRDDWRTLAEHLLTAATWINPATQLACRQAAVSREMACDEWVVRHTASPAAYARCLADVAGLRTRRRRLGLVSAVTGRPGMLHRRVAAVLAFDYRRHAGAIGMAAWTAPVVLCLAAVAILQLPEMFVVAPRFEGPRLVDGRSALVAGTPSAFAPSVPAGLRTPVPDKRDAALETMAAVASSPPAAPAAAGDGMDHEFVPVLPAEPGTSVDHPPLPAVPVPAAGAAGIGAAAGQSGSYPDAQVSVGAWWSGPVELGDRTGAAAASAGRATASFFKRVGSSVPRVFAH
jgi:beta-lactamase regulating signal transducer with metallopeptidase domain